jgi:hypothetical protein
MADTFPSMSTPATTSTGKRKLPALDALVDSLDTPFRARPSTNRSALQAQVDAGAGVFQPRTDARVTVEDSQR